MQTTLLVIFIFIGLVQLLQILRAIAVLDELKKILNRLENPRASAISFYINGEKVEQMFLKVNKNLPVSLKITDKFGNEAKVDGAPLWAVSDASLGAVNAAADGMSASFAPAGPVGSVKVQVSADADLGEGVKSIVGELVVDLVAGDAEVLTLVAGEPV